MAALRSVQRIPLNGANTEFSIPWTAGQALGIVTGTINGNWEIEIEVEGHWQEIGVRFNNNNRYRSIPVASSARYRIAEGQASTGVLFIHRQNM